VLVVVPPLGVVVVVVRRPRVGVERHAERRNDYQVEAVRMPADGADEIRAEP
jgi:hypothetical protein